MTPEEARVPVAIVLGLVAAGGLYFVKMMIFNREVLEMEPSGGDAIHLDPEPVD